MDQQDLDTNQVVEVDNGPSSLENQTVETETCASPVLPQKDNSSGGTANDDILTSPTRTEDTRDAVDSGIDSPSSPGRLDRETTPTCPSSEGDREVTFSLDVLLINLLEIIEIFDGILLCKSENTVKMNNLLGACPVPLQGPFCSLADMCRGYEKLHDQCRQRLQETKAVIKDIMTVVGIQRHLVVRRLGFPRGNRKNESLVCLLEARNKTMLAMRRLVADGKHIIGQLNSKVGYDGATDTTGAESLLTSEEENNTYRTNLMKLCDRLTRIVSTLQTHQDEEMQNIEEVRQLIGMGTEATDH